MPQAQVQWVLTLGVYDLRVSSLQAIEIWRDIPAQDEQMINLRLSMVVGKERLKSTTVCR
jgi:hypothetical protein